MMQDQLLSCTVVSKGIKKKTIIPKKHSVKIHTKEANLFSSTTWADLSKNERETRPPPPPKPELGTVPFFEQPGEPASLTLEQLLHKDCVGKCMYSLYFIHRDANIAINPSTISNSIRYQLGETVGPDGSSESHTHTRFDKNCSTFSAPSWKYMFL